MISVNGRSRTTVAVALVALLLTSCGSDGQATTTSSSSITTTSGSTTQTTGVPTTAISTGVPTTVISKERCDQNKAAGKITYLSSFDFSASASIVDVVTAKKQGYFQQLCLDVDLVSGFSTSNYPLVAAGRAQFSSAGNYTEILNFSRDGAEFVALVDYGKSPIEALVTKDGGATDLSQLKGKTIGVKGDIPPSVVALLAKAGLQRHRDYKEVLLDGFDPATHLQLAIDALPVYKSNEPGQLDAKGIKYHLFDPSTSNIPGSFGLIYTSKEFATKHPSAAQDFTRAALKGMEDALANPSASVAACLQLIDASGNQAFLSLAGETYRWTQEAKIVKAGTPPGEPVGLIDPSLLATEYQTYVDAGVWPDGAPADGKYYDAAVAKSVYSAGGTVVWPG